MALGLAVGAGYVLGRSKKARLALAVGGLVAGKRMNLSPRAVGELVARQLRDNPQFKEVGDQLRQDLSGVGRAASGAVVERRLDSLANRLHGRTSQVREQLAGVTGRRRGDDEDPEASDEPADAADDDAADDDADGSQARDGREERAEAAEESERRAKPRVRQRKAVQAAPEKASARSAPEKKAPARTAAAKKTTAAGKPAARKTAGARRTDEGARGRRTKGDGER
ncbi:DNA primase [Streptomyces sp. NPDC051207]|uniref:DNA primase n=1 Tax=Streptomyces sp. NPDC051207 TaxID=3154641 RepID=UPI003429AAC2